MTIGGIIIAVLLTLLVIVISLWLVTDEYMRKISKIIGVAVTLFIIATIWGGLLWYFNNTESGKRALKTQESELNGGITREVKVYDMEGDLIQSYKGRFDVDYDNDRIIFDDENGLRHIIYYPTGTVVIDEVAK